MTSVVATGTAAFDLDFRPATYFDRRHPEDRILGEARRHLVTRSVRAGVAFDACFLSPRLTYSELDQLQRLHPSLCGGEDLPELEDGEVEIMRIWFPLTTNGEVLSLRARREDSGIAYTICDEYESAFNFRPTWSRLPLTLGQVIEMIDTADGDTDPPGVGGLVAAWDFRCETPGLTPGDLRGDVVVSSEFYLDLGRWYEQRFEQWLSERLERHGV